MKPDCVRSLMLASLGSRIDGQVPHSHAAKRGRIGFVSAAADR
jgi:hypothetical protein